MSLKEPLSSSLKIKEVFKLSLTLLTQNAWFLFLLVSLGPFIIWIFLEDLDVALLSIPFFPMDENLLPDDKKQGLNKFFFEVIVYPFFYSVFLTILTSKLMDKVLRTGRTKISQEDITSCYSSPVFVVGFDGLRTIGVIGCLFAVAFAYWVAAIFLASLADESVRRYFMIALGAITMPPLWYVTSRWSLVVPVTIVEETNPWESFKRSWNLTAACWKQILAVMVPTGLLMYIVIAIVVCIEILIYFDLKDVKLSEVLLALPHHIRVTNQVLFAGLVGPPSSVVMTVCYYFVRKAENGNGTEPEPFSP